MARTSRNTGQQALSVDVDRCRMRLQTGEPIVFVDARKLEDWASSTVQIPGAIRSLPDTPAIQPPCHKHNYIVVYCA